MATKSSIEWTESTWNPVTGCTKVSPGCKNCYAERMAKRLQAMGQHNYREGFNLSVHEHALGIPLKWKKSQNIFVNSMSDLFHEDVPDEFIFKAFDIMNKSHWHNFQVLTKRAERLNKLNSQLPWSSNIWMGVSVETQKYTKRIEYLCSSDAKVKFLSLEPLLGPIRIKKLGRIDWVIVGGESGPGSRPIIEAWVGSIRDQCLRANVPFFFKQWGGINKKKAGRLLDNRIWNEMPKVVNL